MQAMWPAGRCSAFIQFYIIEQLGMKKLFIAAIFLATVIWILYNLRIKSIDTKFGIQYNATRIEYGSPIIHDYLELQSSDNTFEHWHIPDEIHDTIRSGFHAGKGFYIHQDSILQEDDIFRKRINDSTFIFIGILTYGNLKKHKFSSIYYDTVDARSIISTAFEHLDNNPDYMNYYRKHESLDLTIQQADSILNEWGTSRTE